MQGTKCPDDYPKEVNGGVKDYIKCTIYCQDENDKFIESCNEIDTDKCCV